MPDMTASVPDAHTETPADRRRPDARSLPHQIAHQISHQISDELHEIKPKLRGWLHLGMFPAVLVAGLVLTALADSTRGRIACGIYVLTACLLFGVSALYHRGNWSPRMDGILRRLDHANIFLIIAGTYTPLTMLLLPETKGQWLLWGIWGAALAGIVFRVFWVGAPRWLYTPCYIAMGWAAVFFLPDFMRTGGIAVLVLVVVGGLLYSAGGVIYGIKKPNPSPRWFGFHEVFHSLTLAAFVVHYVGISLVAYQHA
ncbi:hemolysin III family protein [Streptomyces neyagawaensis]|nr:hemolysin III family protein [Streptomyces neyagawaensis]MCL6738838.1 hemolysin III family protein [Streptomyces neyagawaensis]MDE1680966.1 hemolysin III family protein [Streptomyces neyagawaensis]